MKKLIFLLALLIASNAYSISIITPGGSGSGTGDVIGPATNTDAYIPQWNGANTKTLKNGLPTAAFGQAWLNLSTAASGRTALNLGSASTANITAVGNTLINQTSTANMVTYLGAAPPTLTSLGISNHNQVTVTSGGSVGVKTTSPQYPLSVSGNAGVTGNLYITGDVLNGTHGSRVIHCSGAASSVTGTTDETTLSSWTVPAGAMGANGALDIVAIFSMSKTGNNKVYRIKFGSTAYFARTKDNDNSLVVRLRIQNANSASSQIGGNQYTPWSDVSPDPCITSSDNTANNVTCTVTGQLGVITDTISLVSISATIVK